MHFILKLIFFCIRKLSLRYKFTHKYIPRCKSIFCIQYRLLKIRLWNLTFRINKIKCVEDSYSVTLQTAHVMYHPVKRKASLTD